MTDDTPLSFHDDQAQTGPVTCSRCETQLSEYWSIDGAVFCERCKDELLAERTSPDGATARVGKAFAYGLGGMIVGALVWYAVARFADLQLGLIAILLGWLVGKGIHYGSEKRGGLGYQVLAVLITYIGIGAASVPFVFEGMDQEIAAMTDSLAAADTVGAGEMPVDSLSDSAIAAQLAQLDSAIASGKEVDAEAVPQGAAIAIAVIALLMLTVTLPVLVVTQGGSLITGIIYAIALWEAWKFAQGSPPAVSGPHSVGGDATG